MKKSFYDRAGQGRLVWKRFKGRTEMPQKVV
jgi:hypothetical protein